MDQFGYHHLTIGDGAAGSIKRGKSRDSMLLRATLRIDGDSRIRETRVRNVSEDGMMADLDRVFATGTRVAIEIRGIGEVAGRIAWCEAGRAGIRFDSPVDPTLARKPVGRRQS